MRLITPVALAALAFFAACSPTREAVMANPEAAAIGAPPAGLASEPSCLPGDDGIGGTGCELD
jgi:hypothetical protein